MFFRRIRPHVPNFEERLDLLRQAGFTVQESGGRTVVAKNGCAALIERGPKIVRTGWIVGNEIGGLIDAGYQKYWRTPSEKRVPARAEQLQALHAFEEDLREELDLKSLYNTSLGTVNANHDYDRLADRDRGVPQRVWQR